MAVISLDFSAQATCPSDNPKSLAQTLTQCNAPKPFFRSWLRRAVLPSTARTGCFTSVAAAAVARKDCSQLAKQAWNAPGFNAARTRRKTSLRGIPCDGGAWVFQRLEVRHDLVQTDPLHVRHRSTLGVPPEETPH